MTNPVYGYGNHHGRGPSARLPGYVVALGRRVSTFSCKRILMGEREANGVPYSPAKNSEEHGSKPPRFSCVW
jgi:hypothetical protein